MNPLYGPKHRQPLSQATQAKIERGIQDSLKAKAKRESNLVLEKVLARKPSRHGFYLEEQIRRGIVEWSFESLEQVYKLEVVDRSTKHNTGYTEYYNADGLFHRVKGPAVVDPLMNREEWHLNGKFHRLDGPAVVNNTVQAWYQNGTRHREDGPALIKPGIREIWYLNGQPHRKGGPAWISFTLNMDEDMLWTDSPDHKERWYVNGELHRTDGPAVVCKDGTKEYWIKGEHIEEKPLPMP